MSGLERVAAALEAAAGLKTDPRSARPVSGGCIHRAWRLEGDGGAAFVKTAGTADAWLFEAEADGLAALAAAGCLRVPAVLGCGTAGDSAWLALEWLELGGGGGGAGHALGEALARQHLAPWPRFGWRRDNAIGRSPQPNPESADWADFFAAQRLGFQLDLGEAHGLPARLLDAGRRLQAAVPALLADRACRPALLHGDLWGGNWATSGGRPVVFDPAVYCGDPEADLAMTRLFGGFGAGFYAAYDAVLPPAPGAATRNRLYQLYHVLNHASLFGGGYAAQAERMIGALLAEL